jgi:hypothetical protein
MTWVTYQIETRNLYEVKNFRYLMKIKTVEQNGENYIHGKDLTILEYSNKNFDSIDGYVKNDQFL